MRFLHRVRAWAGLPIAGFTAGWLRDPLADFFSPSAILVVVRGNRGVVCASFVRQPPAAVGADCDSP